MNTTVCACYDRPGLPNYDELACPGSWPCCVRFATLARDLRGCGCYTEQYLSARGETCELRMAHIDRNYYTDIERVSACP